MNIALSGGLPCGDVTNEPISNRVLFVEGDVIDPSVRASAYIRPTTRGGLPQIFSRVRLTVRGGRIIYSDGIDA